MKLLFACIAGSQMYGTNTPDSDIDIRGVCIEPVESLLGLQKFEQQQYNTNEWAMNKFELDSDDVTIYGLRKFARLALDANPNIVELLFAKPLAATPTWGYLIGHRDDFLSEKVIHTFAGYAFSQLIRIKGHRRWIENPPTKPDPVDFKMVYDVDGGQHWLDSNLYNKYKGLLKDYQNYERWKRERNPKRKALEEKFGYDTKHASHLVRLFYEAKEVLTTGKITLPLYPEAMDAVLETLHGGVPYEKIAHFGENMKDWLVDEKSVLPKKPNFNRIQKAVIDIYKVELL